MVKDNNQSKKILNPKRGPYKARNSDRDFLLSKVKEIDGWPNL